MIKKLELKDIETARQVLVLQIASYQVEAELINFYDIPPLKDTIDSLQECDEIFYGFYKDGDLAGIISYQLTEHILDIHRVAVHPHFFRMGIARELLNFVEGVESHIEKIMVCTGEKNLPATRLYTKKGYRKVKDIEIAADIYLTKFEKYIAS